ncbi:MAG: penicillin acylase family protein, partial [Leptospiraceae bacterium]|nr:penicillin acylase family protein [Leptospiraceae bacterium]
MFKSDKIQIKRSKTGKPIIQAEEERDVYYALGYCNAKDRGLQMLMMRLLGQGRLSEFLDSSDESLKIDLFFRRMNWGKVNFQESDLKQEVLPLIQAYCKGINDAFSQSLPFELNLLGYKHEDWKIKDSVLLSRMMGYIGLAASQEEMEKLFIEMVQAGIKKERLQELFPDLLHEADFELIKKIKLEHRIVEPSSLWQKGLPRLMASNNWVVSGKRTESKFPILANDPHLEVNRLPNVWYEITAFWKDNFVAGAMVPGLPAIIIGRTKHLSWGVTYTFMDSVDSWIEKCSEGNYYREKEGYIPFKKREEIIKRKGKQANHVTFYENNHGVLSGNPDSKEESYLLSTRWSSAESGIHTINNIGN